MRTCATLKNQTRRTIQAKLMKPADIGVIVTAPKEASDKIGTLIMRSPEVGSDKFFSLSDLCAGNVWLEAPPFKVELLTPGTKIELEVVG